MSDKIRIGKWKFHKERNGDITSGYDYDYGYTCSKCGFELSNNWYGYDEFNKYPSIKYCPECGAYMGGSYIMNNTPINLCRAKTLSDFGWIEGQYVYRYAKSGNLHHIVQMVGEVAIDINTLCEFTGLVINGTKIYTGDILRYELNMYEVVRQGYKFNLKGFYKSSYDIPSNAFSEGIDKFDLVGNIYDDAELLGDSFFIH
ncbi:MAG: YopX family protein [Clostridium sp.]|nr:YopX family protein [Clostridium sp.]